MNTSALQEMISLIAGFSEADGIHDTPIAGVSALRFSEVNMRLPSVYTPSLCVIVQGAKQVMLGGELYAYRPSEYLAVSVDLPLLGGVTDASKDKPYLCLQMALKQPLLTELLLASPPSPEAAALPRRGIFVGRMGNELSDAVLRLARLLAVPEEIPFLAPMIQREIHYRLLTGPYGGVIAQFARTGSHLQRVAAAIRELSLRYDQPFRVEDLARQVGMSVSSFHAHFKTITALSPLQYQKRLRLLAARHIMLTEARDATSTAYRVGYESPSQFSREYARLFGDPPGRDIGRLAVAGLPES